MGKICCLLFSLISLSILVGSHASVSPEDYWKLMLPNTPMPQSIQDSLFVRPPYGPPATAESSSKSTDGPGVAIVADTKGSLRILSDYIGLLSYNQKKESSASENHYLSYNQDKSLPNQAGYLSYNQERKPSASEMGYLKYTNQEKSLPDQVGYLSYNQEKKPSASEMEYLKYTNQEKSLPDQVGYLSYNQEKKPLVSENGYLKYTNQEKSAPTTSGYLLSYIKPQSESTKVSPSHVEDSAIKNRQFFMEKDLQIGNKKNLEFKKGTKKGVFLPRDVSNTIPFSSDKVQETLQLLSLDPKSEKAYILSQRIKLCEEPMIQGVEKQCVTSLESMVDYVTSKLGTNVKAMYTKVDKDAKGEYTITGVKRLTKEDRETVVCHKMDYPYAVYFCHRTDTMRSYTVSLVGEDGAKMEAIGACHKEINAMLEDYEINVLKVKPRSARICHFPSSDSIIWARN